MGKYTYTQIGHPPASKHYERTPQTYGDGLAGSSAQIQNDCHITDTEVRLAINQFQSDANSDYCVIGDVREDYGRMSCVQLDQMVGDGVPGSNGHRKKISLHLTESCHQPFGPLFTEKVTVDREVDVIVTSGERGQKEKEKILVTWPDGGDSLPPIPQAKPARMTKAPSLSESWEMTKAYYAPIASSVLQATATALQSVHREAPILHKSISTSVERFIEAHVPTPLQAWGKSLSSFVFGDHTVREVDILDTDRDPVA